MYEYHKLRIVNDCGNHSKNLKYFIMLDRIATVVHWLGFITTLVFGYFIFFDSQDALPFWLKLIVTLAPNTAAWVVAYILSGSRGFFPFGE